MDTLAAAYAESGDFVSAIKWQRKVIENSSDAEELKGAKERLELYRFGRPYRE
jgi:hypothetical protein